MAERRANGRETARDSEPDAEAWSWEDRVEYPENPRACADLSGSDCHWLCVRYATTFLPSAAKPGIECLRKAARGEEPAASACSDPCTRARCTATAFAGVKGPGDARCHTTVREKAWQLDADSSGAPNPSVAGSYAAVIAEGCAAYTSGMNRVGRDMFVDCLLGTMGMGFRVCLWDSTVAPCGHGHAREGPDLDLDEDAASGIP
jgi:hypothetical protein